VTDTNHEDIWLMHVRDSLVPAFPRDFSFKRVPVFNQRHYLTLCNLCHQNLRSGYVSVYSDYEHQNHVFSCLYFDVDGEDILDTTRFVLQMLNEISSYCPLVVFTGGRGYHIFIHLPPVSIDLKKASLFFLDRLNGVEWEDYVDRHALGNSRAMCIVPFTFHRKTFIESRIVRYPKVTQSNHDLAKELAEKFKWEPQGEINLSTVPVGDSAFFGDDFPPCILSCLQKLSSEGELSHEGRMFLSTFLLRSGFEPSEVMQLFSSAHDFNPSVTSYQVNYIVRRGLKAYSCPKAIALGLCPFPIQHCKYYPNVNWWF